MMRALTLRHPWAHAIAHLGKDIENRTWEPSPNVLAAGELFAIHAGKRPPRTVKAMAEVQDAVVWMLEQGIYVEATHTILRMTETASAVVAIARYVGCTTYSTSPWFAGPVGWQLEDVVTLVTPVPCRGAQGLWLLPSDVEASARAQL
jgi:hypothetical protein